MVIVHVWTQPAAQRRLVHNQPLRARGHRGQSSQHSKRTSSNAPTDHNSCQPTAGAVIRQSTFSNSCHPQTTFSNSCYKTTFSFYYSLPFHNTGSGVKGHRAPATVCVGVNSTHRSAKQHCSHAPSVCVCPCKHIYLSQHHCCDDLTGEALTVLAYTATDDVKSGHVPGCQL